MSPGALTLGSLVASGVPALAVQVVFPGLMAFAAFSDAFTMTIPNRLSLGLVAVFLLAAPFAGLGASAIGLHLLVGLLALALGFGAFAAGWMGGGDAKLLAATALWCGPAAGLDYALTASALGGVLTLALLSARGLPLPRRLAATPWIARLHDQRTGVPYGIALAAAGLLVAPATPVFRAAAGL